MTSYVDQKGEWENRKITIFGALQSFISQLSIGEDLTKISLPSVLLYPYSALELGASRGLSYIDVLLRANQQTDPLDRFMGVIKWFLTYTQKEKLGKKPYNPILAEHHISWVESNANFGITKFVTEQVCHHPPVTAFVLENASQNFKMESNIKFGTAFHGNSVTAMPSGPTTIDFGNHREVYTLQESLPNIAIKNVIIGTRRHVWEGSVTIKCEASGYQATLNYYEEGWYCVNTISGIISKISDPETKLFTFYGPLSDVINITNCKTNKSELLIDLTKLEKQTLKYIPFEKSDERDSVKVWRELSDAIAIDDMYKADVAKRAVEDAQRKRRNEGTSYKTIYFIYDEATEMWKFDTSKSAEVDKLIATAFDPIEKKDESKGEKTEPAEKTESEEKKEVKEEKNTQQEKEQIAH